MKKETAKEAESEGVSEGDQAIIQALLSGMREVAGERNPPDRSHYARQHLTAGERGDVEEIAEAVFERLARIQPIHTETKKVRRKLVATYEPSLRWLKRSDRALYRLHDKLGEVYYQTDGRDRGARADLSPIEELSTYVSGEIEDLPAGVGERNPSASKSLTGFDSLPKGLRQIVETYMRGSGEHYDDADSMRGECEDMAQDLADAINGAKAFYEDGDPCDRAEAWKAQKWFDRVPAALKDNDMAGGHYVTIVDWCGERYEIDITAAQFPELGWTGPRARQL